MLIWALKYQIPEDESWWWILANLDLRPFTSLRTVYSINSSKFDVLTAAGIKISDALDDAVKTVETNVEAVYNFGRANVPFDYISFYT